MTTQTFMPTEEELELASRILVTRGCGGIYDRDGTSSSSSNADSHNSNNNNDGGGGGALQGDQAKEVFNRSALPFATLREIWNLSSENGNGVLERVEIAKALRLIGWVQAGEVLSERLLVVAGPLPTLDGITNVNMNDDAVNFKGFCSSSSPSPSRTGAAVGTAGGGGSPQIMVFPAVNEDQVQEFKAAFWEAGPVNGFLSEDKIMSAYMTSDLSYEDIRDIINLIDRTQRRVVDFPEFACGLYLVKALQDSQLHSLPSAIPPDIFDQFMTDPSNNSSSAPTSSGSYSSTVSPPPPPPLLDYRRQLSSSSSTSTLSPPSTSTTRHRHSYLAQQPSLRVSKPRMSTPPSPNHHYHHHQSASSSSSTTTTATITETQNKNNEVWEEISQHDRNMFELYFRKLDGNNMGYLDREAFDEFVSVYRVPAADLERIWGLTTLDRDGFMKRDEFTIAMHLVKQRSETGREIPTSLPLSILPPSLKSSRRNTIAFSSSSPSLAQKISIKRPPPPVPPKRRESLLMKGIPSTTTTMTTTTLPLKTPSLSQQAAVSPPISPRPTNPFRQTMSFSAGSLTRSSAVPRLSSSSSSSIPTTPLAKSPFDDSPDYSRMNGIPRPQSPPVQPLLPPPPPPPPPPPTQPLLPPPSSSPPSVNITDTAAAAAAAATAAANHERESSRSRDEISRLSRQIEVLLTQLQAQNELRATNDSLRLENDTLKTQGKDMEKMMADILAVNETESAGSLEQHAQDITRLVGELGEKEAQCEEQERRIRALVEDEKEMRGKMREMEGAMTRCSAEAADYRQTIELQRQEMGELSARVGDMSKVLADEPELNRRGGSNTTSNRELRVLIRDVTRENDSLKSEVRDMHRSMEQLLLSTKHAKYDEMELENRKLKKSVGELEIMVAQLQTSVGVAGGSNHRRRGQDGSDGLARENEQLKTQLQDGKRQFADFRSTSETKMVDLQQKIEELTRENNRLKVDIHDASEGGREDGSVPPPAYDESFVSTG